MRLMASFVILFDLRLQINRDPLYELCEQDKQALWSNRYWCLSNLPAALPWLSQAVCWHKREILMEFYHLLDLWPHPLDVSVALQLLGAMGLTNHSLCGSNSSSTSHLRDGASGVADAYLRQLAVSSLQDLSDAELADYLLQLVQVSDEIMIFRYYVFLII